METKQVTHKDFEVMAGMVNEMKSPRGVLVLGSRAVAQAVEQEGRQAVGVEFELPDSVPFEKLLALCKKEQVVEAIVQFGGSAALKMANAFEANGIRVLGTSEADIARMLDRTAFLASIKAAHFPHPDQGIAATLDEAKQLAERLKYPLLARSGETTVYVGDVETLERAFVPGMLLQTFMMQATHACVELVRDRKGKVVIAGVVESVEPVGVHTADAAWVLPPHSLKSEVIEKMKDSAAALANEFNVVGMLDVHFAVQGKAISVLEANPRASRLLPFVSKATGVDFAALAARVVLGRGLEELGAREPSMTRWAVREAVFSENVQLGPTQRSTGEVIAIADSLALAFGESQREAGTALPSSGKVFVSVPNDDKPAVVDLCKRLLGLGFSLCSTVGTQQYLAKKGVVAEAVRKVREGGTHIAELISKREVSMVICAAGFGDYDDGLVIRRAARVTSVPHFTTVEAARMAVSAIEARAVKTN